MRGDETAAAVRLPAARGEEGERKIGGKAVVG